MESNNDFSKDFFQSAWGENGYYENFSYGIGIDKVCEIAMKPFFNLNATALEIGCGGGVFTQRLLGNFQHLTAIDVIKMPPQFKDLPHFKYVELDNQDFNCTSIAESSIDFCFSYNVFCHLSNEALAKYLLSINKVLKSNGNFVFMIANFQHSKLHFLDKADTYKLGDMLPIGHFYQDVTTLDIIVDKDQWQIVSSNLTPEHRDIVVHLRKF